MTLRCLKARARPGKVAFIPHLYFMQYCLWIRRGLCLTPGALQQVFCCLGHYAFQLCFLLLFSLWCVRLFDPMDCSMPGFPVLHYFLEFVHPHDHWVSDAIQPSHPFPSPEDLPNSGIEPASPVSPALAGGFFSTSATWEVQRGTRDTPNREQHLSPVNKPTGKKGVCIQNDFLPFPWRGF